MCHSGGRGGGRYQDWSEQEKKNGTHSEVRMVEKRCMCYQHPMVLLDGFRQVGHSEILLNMMLKIMQHQGIDI